jgi:hypothetical protein
LESTIRQRVSYDAAVLREHLFHKRAPADPLFRWRGREISRIEALSDAVFALTITLVVATTQVPETFPEIWGVFLDAPVLAVCFTLLVLLWHDHYLFFRRYGLEDAPTIALNLVLLFLVLLYAYPLRFMFSFIWNALVLGTIPPAEFFPVAADGMPFGDLFVNPYSQAIWMMYLYGAGCASVFLVLFLMHLRAYRKREQLGLDEIELALTRGSLRSHGISCGIAVGSILVAGMTAQAGIAGMVYILNAPLHIWNGFHTTRTADRAKERADQEALTNASHADKSAGSAEPDTAQAASADAPQEPPPAENN